VITADDFLRPAREKGFTFFSGVPCSFLTPFINGVIGDTRIRYVGAASEGEAVAIAAGAWLAGRKTVVMCQNSGLGNAVNPLTSLNHPFQIPTLLIVTWRGQPGIPDEPQHELMGPITPAMLDVMKIPHGDFPSAADAIGGSLDSAIRVMDQTSLPFAYVMAKDTVRDGGLQEHPQAIPSRGRVEDRRENGQRPKRAVCLEALLGAVPDETAIIATTGKCGRELFTIADRKQHLYQVGSMGCASGMGLGVALNTKRPVIVLDGDGAALMKMGTFATIGAHAPKNLIHIVLDNGVHDSTGGQPTVSASVDFAAVAAACGYASATMANSVPGFLAGVKHGLTAPGPHLIHLRIAPGSLEKLGRPTVKPPEVARRFKAFLASSTDA
jgi:phosphonopyruvate decarboxylase